MNKDTDIGNQNVDKLKSELVIRSSDRYGETKRPDVFFHTRVTPDQRGRFAQAIIERWAMVMGTPDGEDAAGRQKLKLMDEREIVERAVGISAKAFDAFEERGWLIESPSYEDIEADAEAKRKNDRESN